jgi:hypothetical protein
MRTKTVTLPGMLGLYCNLPVSGVLVFILLDWAKFCEYTEQKGCWFYSQHIVISYHTRLDYLVTYMLLLSEMCFEMN